MDALTFFVLVPGVFALIQFFISRSRLPRRVKYLPAVLVLAVGLICVGGMVGVLPLPRTYYVDRHSFLAFPDYWYFGVFVIPALIGVGIGAVLASGMAEAPEEEEKP